MLWNELILIENPTKEYVLNRLAEEYGYIMHTRYLTNKELKDIRNVVKDFEINIVEFFKITEEM